MIGALEVSYTVRVLNMTLKINDVMSFLDF
jgi:hypothetical protein